MNSVLVKMIPAFCLGGALLLPAAPARAMEPMQSYPQEGYQQQSNQRQSRQQRSRQQQSGQSQRQMQDDPRYVVDPQGWIRIAYDFDQDGQVDAVEWIFAYDLDRARQSSQNRMRQQQSMQQGMAQQGMAQQGNQRMRQPQQGMQSGNAPQRARLSGEIQNLRTVNLIGTRTPHVIATVQSDRGRTATVDLGPQDQVEQLNFQRGDTIEVRGFRGSINQKPALMAKHVESDGQTVTIERGRAFPMKPAHGTIAALRTVQSPRGGEHLFATLELRQGRFVTVDLGPKQFIQQQTNLQQGDEIAVLATPRRTRNGNWFLQAQRLNVDGQPINIAQAVQQVAQGGTVYNRMQDSSASSDEQVKMVTLKVENMTFTPAKITCQPGQTIMITLENSADTEHGIKFELPNEHPSLQKPLQPNETGTITFTAPDQPGEYTFYCPIGKHAEQGMKGTLVVRSSSSQ